MAKKKKILLLSEDLRMHRGLATMSREFVLGTVDKYDWVQLGGAVKHPEEGKVIEKGTYDQLLDKKGKFYEMHKSGIK